MYCTAYSIARLVLCSLALSLSLGAVASSTGNALEGREMVRVPRAYDGIAEHTARLSFSSSLLRAMAGSLVQRFNPPRGLSAPATIVATRPKT